MTRPLTQPLCVLRRARFARLTQPIAKLLRPFAFVAIQTMHRFAFCQRAVYAKNDWRTGDSTF